jgi:hypothetical protein
MTLPMWSEADAEQLDGLLDDLAAAQQPWDATLQRRLVAATPWLLGKPDHEWFHYVKESRTFAPSLRLEFLDDYRKLSQLDIDAASVVRRAQTIESERAGPLATPIDVAVQFPTYGQPENGTHRMFLSSDYLRRRYQLRFVRTAVALRLYRVRHGSFPERLEQLTSVGLPAEALRDPIGELMEYRQDEAGGCTLANASRPFFRLAGFRSYQTPDDDMLATVLDQFRVLELAE